MLPFFWADLAVFFFSSYWATAKPARQMCVYAFKKESSKGKQGERTERRKSNVLFVFFAVRVEKQPRGHQINQVTSGNSTGRPDTGPWSSSPSCTSHHVLIFLTIIMFFFIAFPSSFPPHLDPYNSFNPQTIPSSSSSSASKWDRFLELWGHSSPATIRHLLASTAKSWMHGYSRGGKEL